MSDTIDQRVVEMQLDNSNFEKNAQTSMDTTEKLKKSLDFNGTANSLNEVGKAASNLNFSGVASAVDSINNKMSLLGTFSKRIMENVADGAFQMGKSLLTSISGINDASAGLEKFGQKSSAVGTMMIATGKSIDEVGEVLEDLNWFTDETSYSFTDMADTMGKFAASGEKDLTKLDSTVKGIATWAAASGANASTASRVMYQLSQAYGSGVIKLQDWRSVESANMATQTVMNKLIAEGGDAAQAAVAKYGSFRDSLQAGWLTTDKFNAVMADYSEGINQANYENGEFTKGTTAFSESVFRAAQEARTFQDVLNALKDAVQSGWMHTFDILIGNKEEAAGFFTGLANMLITVADAFTELRNSMAQAFVDADGRNSALSVLVNIMNGLYRILTPIADAFKEVFPTNFGTVLAGATKSFADFTKNIQLTAPQMEILKEVFVAIFSVIKGGLSVIKAILKLLSPLGKVLISVAKAVGNLLQNVDKLNAPMKEFFNMIKNSKPFQTFISILKDFASVLVVVIYEIGQAIKALVQSKQFQQVLGIVLSTLKTFGAVALGVVVKAVDAIVVAFKKLKSADFKMPSLEAFLKKIANLGNTISSHLSVLDGVKTNVNGLFNPFAKLGTLISNLPTVIGNIKTAITGGGTALDGVNAGIKTFSNNADTASASVTGAKTSLKGFAGVIYSVLDKLSGANNIFGVIASGLKLFIAVASKIDWSGWLKIGIIVAYVTMMVKLIHSLTTGPVSAFTKLVNNAAIAIKGFSDYLTKSRWQDTLKSVAISVLLLSASLLILAKIPIEQLIQAAITMGVLAVGIIAFAAAMAWLSQKVNPQTLGVLSVSLISLSLSLLIFAAAIRTFTNMTNDQMMQGLVGTMATLVIMFLAVKGFSTQAPMMMKVGASLIIFAYALRTFAKTIVILANNKGIQSVLTGIKDAVGNFLKWLAGLNTQQAITVIGTLGTIGVLLGVSLKKITNAVDSVGNAMLKIAESMLILWAAFALFLQLDYTQMQDAITVMGVLGAGLVVFAGFLNVFCDNKATSGNGLADTANSTIKLAAALGLVAGALWILNKCDMNKVAIGGLVLIAMLFALAGAMKIMENVQTVKVAASILALAVSIYLLIPPCVALGALISLFPTIAIGFGVVIGMMLAMGAAVKMMEKANAGKIAAEMLIMTVAIGILGVVLTSLANLPYEAVLASGAALSATLLAMSLAVSKMNTDAWGTKIAMLAALSVSMVAFGYSMSLMANVPWQTAVAAAGGFSAVILAFALATDMLTSKIKTIKAMSVAMIALGAALAIASVAFSVMGKINWKEASKGAIAFGAIMIVFAAITSNVKSSDSTQLGVAMIALSAALTLAAIAFGIMGLVNWDQAVSGVLAFSLIMVVFAGIAAQTQGADMIGTAASLIILSAAICVIAVALAILGAVDAAPVMSSVLAISLLIGVFGLLAGLTQGVDLIATAAGLLVFSVAIIAIAAALTVLSSLDVGAMWGAIGAIAVVVALFGALVVVLSLFPASIAVLGAIAAAFAGFALAAIAVGAAIALVCVGFALLTAAIGFVLPVLASFIAMLPQLITNIADVANRANDVSSLGNALVILGIGLVAVGAGGVVGAIGLIAIAAALAIAGVAIMMFATCVEEASKIIGEDFILGIIKGLTNGISSIVQAAINVGQALMDGICEFLGIHSPSTEGATVGTNWIAGIINSIKDNIVNVFTAGSSTGKVLQSGLQETTENGEAKESGTSVISKFIDGVKSGDLGAIGSALGIDFGSNLSDGVMSSTSGLSSYIAKLLGMSSKAKGQISQSTANFRYGSSKAAKASGANIKSDYSNWPDMFDPGDFTGSNNDAPPPPEPPEPPDALSKSTDGLANSASGAAAAEKTLAESIADSTDVMVYGQDVVDAFQKQYEKFYGAVGTTTAVDASKAAITSLSTDLYNSSLKTKSAYELAQEAALSTEEKMKNIKQAFTDTFDGIKSAIDGAIDIFSEFETSEALSPDQVMKNMNSNLNGVTKWTNDLTTLMGKGISTDLAAMLAEKGPEGESTVQGLLGMSDIQLAEYDAKYATIQQLSTQFAGSLMGTMAQQSVLAARQAATSATQVAAGFTNQMTNVESANISTSMETAGTKAIDSFNKAMGVASPSTETAESAKFAAKGFQNGLLGGDKVTGVSNAQLYMYNPMETVGKKLIEIIKTYLNYDDFKKIGEDICKGLAQGIAENQHLAVDAAEGMASDVNYIVKDTEKNGSPSKVMWNFGDDVATGFGNGISDNAKLATTAAERMAIGVNDQLSASAMSMSDAMNTVMSSNLQPSIRPVMDYSNIQTGASNISSILGGQADVAAEINNGVDNDRASIAELLSTTKSILGAVINGSDVYIDGDAVIGQINRRLGQL